FKWNGGDPSVDAPRGKAFVTLERQGAHGFEPVATEDSVVDVTEHARDQTWTETWQFTECDPLGTYRFTVHGMANKGSGLGPDSVEARCGNTGGRAAGRSGQPRAARWRLSSATSSFPWRAAISSCSGSTPPSISLAALSASISPGRRSISTSISSSTSVSSARL